MKMSEPQEYYRLVVTRCFNRGENLPDSESQRVRTWTVVIQATDFVKYNLAVRLPSCVCGDGCPQEGSLMVSHTMDELERQVIREVDRLLLLGRSI